MGISNLNDSLRYLADETGGMAIYNTNDVGPKLDLISQDMFTYYSLGYPLQASGSDRVHKVRVKLRDDPAFENYQLRYRSRFVEKSLETRVQDAVISSLVFDVVDNPMDLEVTTGTPVAGERGTLDSARRDLFPDQQDRFASRGRGLCGPGGPLRRQPRLRGQEIGSGATGPRGEDPGQRITKGRSDSVSPSM